jgi:hypothetical protein
MFLDTEVTARGIFISYICPFMAPTDLVLQAVSKLSVQAGTISLQSNSSMWKGIRTVCFQYLRWVP